MSLTARVIRPYQQKGADFFAMRGGAANFDEPGLGKTVQAIIGAKDKFPCLVISNNTNKYFWKSEEVDWGEYDINRIHVFETTDRRDMNMFKRPDIDVYIIHWEALRFVEKELLKVKWRCVIVDEAHRMKNRKTQQSKILRKMRPEHRYVLTATPIINRPDELWALLNFLFPKKYTSYWKFFHEHILAVPRITHGNVIRGYDIIGVRDSAALRDELRPFVIRRLKKNVQPELPPKVYTTIEVELAPEQRKAYNEMREEFITWLGDKDIPDTEIAASTVLTQMIRLRQITTGLFLLDPDTKARSAKVDAILELISDIGDRSVVIFVQFVESAYVLQRGIQKMHINVAVITGRVRSAIERERIRLDFQAKKIQVLIITLNTGKESITLTAADTMIFMDRPWSPLHLESAEDRIHRQTQEADTVFYISIVARDTLDSHIDKVLKLKSYFFSQVFQSSNMRTEVAKVV